MEKLKEKNAYYDLLMENMSEGVLLQDHFGRVLQFNTAAPAILGLSAEQLLGTTSRDALWKTIREDGSELSPPERPAAMARLSGLPQKKIVVGVCHGENEVRWISTNAVPIFQNNSKTFTQILCTFTDITEEKKLLNKIKKSETKFKALFEHAPLGIVELDSERRYLEANHAFSKMVGYTNEELKQMCMFDTTHPEDLIQTKWASEQFIDSNFFLKKLKKRYVTKDGGIVWGQVSSRSFEVEKNSKRHLFTVIEDITEQMKMEEDLREKEAKILYSSKMAALGEMAAGMSHEINNPLAIISGYAGLIKDQLNKEISPHKIEAIKDKLGKIEQTVERIAKIVRGLRIFSRNSEQDPKVPVLLSQSIDDTLNLCQDRFKKHSIEIKVIISNDIEFMGRPSQIGQVLLNLLNNSFDAIQSLNQKWIQIRTETENNILKIMVTDSGDRIPKDVELKIMQPFFTTKDVGKGMGLGLSISKGIIEGHSGKFYLDASSPNTQFIIELPIYDQ